MSRHVVHVVVTDRFAGVERYVATAASGLYRRGWRVTVIGGEAALMRAALEPGVNHHRATGICSAIRRLVCCHQVDLVHAHMTAAELATAVSAPILRAPAVATRHFAAQRGSAAGGRVLAAIIRRRLAVQLAPSQFVADRIGEVCQLLPSGVPDQPRSANPRERIVLVLQRMAPEKATDVALAAFATSGLVPCGWRLVVAGRGSAESALRQQTHDLAIADAVDFVGFVPDPTDLLTRASMLLAPAPAEPFGLSVAEAMATGLPVIAAGSGAHPELLGADGFMFPPGKSRRAGELLRLLAQDPDRRLAYGEELRSRQRELFSLDRYLDDLEHAYLEVLNRS